MHFKISEITALQVADVAVALSLSRGGKSKGRLGPYWFCASSAMDLHSHVLRPA